MGLARRLAGHRRFLGGNGPGFARARTDRQPGLPGDSRHEFTAEQIRGQCVLVTGRVFWHLFSAAITLTRDNDAPAFTVLDIDVADRCREPVEVFAATYLVRLGSSELVEAGPNAITWSGGAIGTARLELLCEPPGSLVLAEAGRQATRVQALAAITPGDYTHRLRYRWRWAAASDAGAEITR